jgi:hypothetical protein
MVMTKQCRRDNRTRRHPDTMKMPA